MRLELKAAQVDTMQERSPALLPEGGPIRLLRAQRPGDPAAYRDAEHDTRERNDDGDDSGRRLVCASCGHLITHPRERIEVAGAHRHTFANPHGFVYHIGCFAAAAGCVAIGPPSMEFPWFPGHAWQIAICGRCGVHLGWAFRSEQRFFHGLILDKLAEDDAGQRRDTR